MSCDQIISFRTNQLLENICEGVEPSYFYTCIWLCVANNSPVRLPAISYVLAHYSRKLKMEDQLSLMGNDIGLMVIFVNFKLELYYHLYFEGFWTMCCCARYKCFSSKICLRFITGLFSYE